MQKVVRSTIIMYHKNTTERLQQISVLRSKGHDVIGVSSGLDILVKAGKYGPDVIIVCASDNDPDYLDVIRSIKSSNKTKEIPIITIFNSEDKNVVQGLVQKAKEMAVDSFLFKPFDYNFAEIIMKDVQKKVNERKSILVVDDDPCILDVLKTAITKAGYNVFTSDDGREAFEKARSLIPDLIIIDYLMPGCNGLYSIRRMKEIQFLQDIPIIGHTALVNAEIIAKSVQVGCAMVLKKPANIHEILEKVKVTIDAGQQKKGKLQL